MSKDNTRLAVGLARVYLLAALRANSLLEKAQEEGRDITDEEFASLQADDDSAKAKLDAAIAKRGG